jgi:hypothetical protein
LNLQAAYDNNLSCRTAFIHARSAQQDIVDARAVPVMDTLAPPKVAGQVTERFSQNAVICQKRPGFCNGHG